MKNLDCRGMHEQSQQKMESEHAKPCNLRNMRFFFICVSIGLVMNTILVVGVMYDLILDEVLNPNTYESFSFGSHTRQLLGLHGLSLDFSLDSS